MKSLRTHATQDTLRRLQLDKFQEFAATLVPASAQMETAVNHRLQNLRPDQFRVLVVLDEIYAQKAMIEYVHQEGYRVTGTGDVKEAVRTFGQEAIHLVIADLTRPQLQAPKMVAAMKKHKGALRAVALVEKLPEVEDQAQDDFDGYLVKPISREEVSKQLSELLLTPHESHEPTVVVVDEDANALMAVEHTLDVRGFKVAPFTDVGEALGKIESEPPDLLILDSNMPGISGLEVCKRLKSSEKTNPIPILIFTSGPSRENVQEAITAGANGFIAKPFDPKGLTDKAREVLGGGH